MLTPYEAPIHIRTRHRRSGYGVAILLSVLDRCAEISAHQARQAAAALIECADHADAENARPSPRPVDNPAPVDNRPPGDAFP